MNRYTVLWIEDEPEKQEAFLEQAYLNGIDLKQFDTNKEGIEELSANRHNYDAVILDAKGYAKSKEEKTSLLGLMNSIKAIQMLQERIPYFIYTGYLEQDEYQSARDLLQNEEIFTKGKDNDKIIERIKQEADKQIETQVRHDYSELFRCLAEYDPEASKNILNILKSIRFGGQGLEDHLYFNPIRLILEELFRKANKVGLLHDACIGGRENKVNLTESSRFMAGIDTAHLKVKCTKSHFPKIIANSVQSLLNISGAASHTADVDITKNIDLQTHRQYLNTPYLLFNLTFMISDVLIWFDKYLSENNDLEKNKAFWAVMELEGEWQPGTITRIQNGWATFQPENGEATIGIPPRFVEAENLLENEAIEIITQPSPDGSKTHIKAIKRAV